MCAKPLHFEFMIGVPGNQARHQMESVVPEHLHSDVLPAVCHQPCVLSVGIGVFFDCSIEFICRSEQVGGWSFRFGQHFFLTCAGGDFALDGDFVLLPFASQIYSSLYWVAIPK